ncbi:uncharacterized protein [Branchiostoma lanceolatum]|uniref:uncharacterized protein isoform X2 n=1 Tax=Branchiostoma lanceolatum TaxID=7740 RepID=UPI0034534B3C
MSAILKIALLLPCILVTAGDKIRLPRGPSPREGVVEVWHDMHPVWSRICHRDWDTNDAKVVCRQLGFTRAVETVAVLGADLRYPPPNGTDDSPDTHYWPQTLQCVGTEASLSDCPHGGWNIHNCSKPSESAGVFCNTGDCDFDSHSCGYHQYCKVGSCQGWGRRPPPIPPANSTAGSGQCMATNVSGSAQLVSPFLHSSTRCMEFAYFMHGNATMRLAVRLWVDSLPAEGNALWMMSGKLKDDWHVARIGIGVDKNFQVMFDGEVIDGSDGIVAIDNVTLSDSPCQARKCSDLPVPAHGYVMYDGDAAHYGCWPGYQLLQPSNRTCLGNGNWTGDATVCQGRSEDYVPLIAGVAVSVFLLAAIGGTIYKLHRRQNRHLIAASRRERAEQNEYGRECPRRLRPLEFSRDRITLGRQLGKGQYGVVYKAEAWQIAGSRTCTNVAVKQLILSSSDAYMTFHKELLLMEGLEQHPNVVSLLGCCTREEPFYLILEFVSGGSLQSLLRKSQPDEDPGGAGTELTNSELTKFAMDVARGMAYLASKKIIHRDLASRNVLVTDDRVSKVSDFGMSRRGEEYERTTEVPLPVRWMAPESLFEGKYTSRSDVWSFGVLLWEIVMFGKTPYPGMTNHEVRDRIKDGYRMDRPRNCEDHMYDLMTTCWAEDPEDRPDFSGIVLNLENEMEEKMDYFVLGIDNEGMTSDESQDSRSNKMVSVIIHEETKL